LKNIKYIIFILFFFELFPLFIYSKDKSENWDRKNLIANLKNFKKESIFIYKYALKRDEFKNILIDDDINIERLLTTIIPEEKVKDNVDDFEVDIESDSNYVENNIFIAEGNVIVKTKRGVINTDKLIYDRQNKKLIAIGNIVFVKGKQFFEASYLEFNFIEEKGYINDIYGVIDFNYLSQDLNLNNVNESLDICNYKNIDLNNLPSEVDVLKTSNIRFKNKLALDSFKIDFSDIKTWRFKSKKINLSSKKWNSDLVFFTNDPYNDPQLFIKSKNFSAEVIDEGMKFYSKSTYINFEDKISIPIGSKTIQDKDAEPGWSIGYEEENKDGLFFQRGVNPILFNEQLSINLKPYFLIQRAIQGESNAFRAKNSSITSDNKKTQIDFLDYLAISTIIEGKIFGEDFNINADFKSINPDKLYDSISADFNLIKNLYRRTIINKKEVKEICDKDTDDSISENYWVDIGGYGSFNRGDIYLSKGLKLISGYSFAKRDFTKNYDLILDYGHHKGKAELDNSQLLSQTRYGFTSVLRNNFKLIDFDKDKKNYDNSFRYSPNVNTKGIWINGKISTGSYQYSNGLSQSVIQAGVGPELVFGNLKNKVFDYTSFTFTPEFNYKKGISPLKFDNFNDHSRLIFDLKQQIYGPILLGFNASLNLQNDHPEYGEFSDRKFSLFISRRAYAIDLTYNQDEKYVLFNFNIFNFGYRDYSPSF